MITAVSGIDPEVSKVSSKGVTPFDPYGKLAPRELPETDVGTVMVSTSAEIVIGIREINPAPMEVTKPSRGRRLENCGRYGSINEGDWCLCSDGL